MTAVQELLVDRLVTAAAISGRELRRDDKAVMVLLLLTRSRLMAFEAADAFAGVLAHFIFVDHRVLRARVALGTLAGSAHQGGAGLLGFRRWACSIDQEGCQDQGKRNHDGKEDRSK